MLPILPHLLLLVLPCSSDLSPDAAGGGDPDAGRGVLVRGSVLAPEGGPARGAIVVSSAGGQAVVAADGSFALEVELPRDACALELTAVAQASAGTRLARRTVGGLCDVDALGDHVERHAGTLVLAASQGCSPEWLPTLGATGGLANNPYALAVFDDGAGPALYIGGTFLIAGDMQLRSIAKWNGTTWTDVGGGASNGSVYALEVFDDGSGPALYVGGSFTAIGTAHAERIARWDGTSWSAVGDGADDDVRALAAFDDGSGPALYAGGAFTEMGSTNAKRVARWDGTSWSALGLGMNRDVLALCGYDDGSDEGPFLIAGGEFDLAGGQPADQIAAWNGTSWTALGSGIQGGAPPRVNAVAAFDDGLGLGPMLFAAGTFTTAGGAPANNVARWNGRSWSAVGLGLGSPGIQEVLSLAVFDDGSGPALFAGSEVPSWGGVSFVGKWNGVGWTSVPGADSVARDFAVLEGGSEGGSVLFIGGQTPTKIAAYDGSSMSSLGAGPDAPIRALTVFDDGEGPALVAAFAPSWAHGETHGRVARWDGAAWQPMGPELDGVIWTLYVHDDGSGAAIHAGGDFQGNVARWTGTEWAPLGSGLGAGVRALVGFDDGSGRGKALIAGGLFGDWLGGHGSIAAWDGRAWSLLGGGVNDYVFALTTFDDGKGEALYAGGRFTSAGGVPANRIARWDGRSFSALGDGVGAGSNKAVAALAVHDDGSGPALYAGGLFTATGGGVGNAIARWDGAAWSPLGSGLNSTVETLAVFDDGSGSALYAGGWFTSAGGLAANRVARWDGAQWSALSSGMNDSVRALVVHDAGAGPVLYAGGAFTASAAGDSYFARWGCPSIHAVPGCFGNPATLTALTSDVTIGADFSAELAASATPAGLGLLMLGQDATDRSGCGVPVPGVGELLLGLTPLKQIASGALSAGKVVFDLPVPDSAALVGQEIALHGVAVAATGPGLSIELSNGLVATIVQ